MSKVIVDKISSKRKEISFNQNYLDNVYFDPNTTTYDFEHLIETISAPCDGRKVRGLLHEYVIEDVGTSIVDMSTTYTDMKGSKISYRVIPGTKSIHYRFSSQIAWLDSHAISHFRFFVNSQEIKAFQTSISGQYVERRNSFQYRLVNCKNEEYADYERGIFQFPETMEMKIMCRDYGASDEMRYNSTHYFDGGGNYLFCMPVLTIMAFG